VVVQAQVAVRMVKQPHPQALVEVVEVVTAMLWTQELVLLETRTLTAMEQVAVP
jgi:hypothetical protein